MFHEIAATMNDHAAAERLDERHVRMAAARALEWRVTLQAIVRRAVVDVCHQCGRSAPKFWWKLRLKQTCTHATAERVNIFFRFPVLELLMLDDERPNRYAIKAPGWTVIDIWPDIEHGPPGCFYGIPVRSFIIIRSFIINRAAVGSNPRCLIEPRMGRLHEVAAGPGAVPDCR